MAFSKFILVAAWAVLLTSQSAHAAGPRSVGASPGAEKASRSTVPVRAERYSDLRQRSDEAYLEGLKGLSADVVREKRPSYGAVAGDTARIDAMRETAIALGAQGGLHYESSQVMQALEKHSDLLDRGFDFRALLITDRSGRSVLPPVISEASPEAVLGKDGQRLRVAARTYRVDVAARFVLAAPTWRDYLNARHAVPVEPDPFLLPENDDESLLWSKWVEEGWRAGVRQARLSATNSLRWLVRDFTGMVRYHLLRMHGYVTQPEVGVDYYHVTGGGETMAIEDVVLTINRPAELNPNSEEWSPIPRLPEFGYLGLAGIFEEADPRSLWDVVPDEANTRLRSIDSTK